MTPTEKAIYDFCGHHADWWPSIGQIKEIQTLAAPVQSAERGEPVAWLYKDDWGRTKIAFSKETANEWGAEVQPLYTTPPAQPEQERNFCPRCGKRTADLTVIHTCTPPQEKNT